MAERAPGKAKRQNETWCGRIARNIRERLADDGDRQTSGGAPIFETLETRVLLSANPLADAVDARGASFAAGEARSAIVMPLAAGAETPADGAQTRAGALPGAAFPSLKAGVMQYFNGPTLVEAAVADGDAPVIEWEFRVVNLSTWSSTTLARGDAASDDIAVTLDPGVLGENMYFLELEARDAAGNVTIERRVVQFDTAAPTVALTAPDYRHDGSGLIIVRGSIADTGNANQLMQWTLELENTATGERFTLQRGQGVRDNAALSIFYGAEYPAGDYNLVLTATDWAGNASTDSTSITLTEAADAGPVVTLTHDADPIMESGRTVNVTVDAHAGAGLASRWLVVNGEKMALDSAGRAAFVAASPGVYTVEAFAADGRGRVSRETFTFTVADIDAEAPIVAIASSPTGSVVAGETVRFAVTATDNVGVDRIVFTVDGLELPLGPDGAAEFSFAAPGRYEVRAAAIDAAGNIGEAIIVVDVLAQADTEAPMVAVTHDARPAMYPGDALELTVIAADNVGVESLTLTVNGRPVSLDEAGQARYVFETTGAYEFEAIAIDAAGNIGVERFTILVAEFEDIQAPTVTVAHDGGSEIYPGDTVEFTVVAVDDVGVASLVLVVDGEELIPDADGKVFHAFSAAGVYEIRATATDAAGNIGHWTGCVAVSAAVDVEPPAVTVSHDAPATILPGQQVNFAVTATDNVDVVSVSMTVNGETVELDADGLASYSFAAVGEYEVIVAAVDAAGNETVETLTFSVEAVADIDPPFIEVTTLQYFVHPGETIWYHFDAADHTGVVDKYFIIDGQRHEVGEQNLFGWSFAKAGIYTLQAVAVDAAGNTATREYSVVVADPEVAKADAAPPEIHVAGPTFTNGQLTVNATISDETSVGWGIRIVRPGTTPGPYNTYTGFGTIVTCPVSTVYSGQWEVFITAFDENGNSATISRVYDFPTAETPVDFDYDTRTWGVNWWTNYSFLDADAHVKAGTSGTFTLAASVPNGSATLVIDGMAVAGAQGETQKIEYEMHFDAPGRHTVSYILRDESGAVVATGTRDYTVVESFGDQPRVSFEASATTVKAGETVDFTAIIEADNPYRTMVMVMSPRLDGSSFFLPPNGVFSMPMTVPGQHNVILYVMDEFRNRAVVEIEIWVEAPADAEPPAVTVVHDAPATILPGQKVNFSVTATDNTGVVSTTMTINGKAVDLDADGLASYSFAAVGEYEVVAVAVDAAGNETTETLTFSVTDVPDTRAPSVGLGMIEGHRVVLPGEKVTFFLMAADNMGVTDMYFLIDGQRYDSDALGHLEWSFAEPGAYALEGVAVDAAGNMSRHGFSVIVSEPGAELTDVSPPEIRLLEPTVVDGQAHLNGIISDETNVTWEAHLLRPGQTPGKYPNSHGTGPVIDIPTWLSGEWELFIIATDAVGNTATVSRVYDIPVGEPVAESGIAYFSYSGRYGEDWRSTSHISKAAIFVKAGSVGELEVSAMFPYGSLTLIIDGQVVAEATDLRHEWILHEVSFDTPGSHTASYILRDAEGAVVETRISTLVVVDSFGEPARVSLETDTATAKPGEPVDFQVVVDADRSYYATATIESEDGALRKGFYVSARDGFSFSFPAPGVYKVTLFVRDELFNDSEAVVYVTVEAPAEGDKPVVDVRHSASAPAYPGQKVDFAVTASGNTLVESLVLTIDGEPVVLGADGTAFHIFAAAGVHEVRAVATDAAGNVGVFETTVTVVAVADVTPPRIDMFEHHGVGVRPGEAVLFTLVVMDEIGVAEKYMLVEGKRVELDAFGRGEYAFAAAGVYEVEGVAVDTAGNRSARRTLVVVADAWGEDVAAPEITLDSPEDGAIVGSGTPITGIISDPDSRSVSWTVMCGDANGGQSYLYTWGRGHVIDVPMRYLADGDYILTFIARDEAGNASVITRNVTVENPEPPQSSPMRLAFGNAYNVDNFATGGGMQNFLVGDTIGVFMIGPSTLTECALVVNGQAFEGRVHERVFDVPGTYTVTAFARYADGSVATDVRTFNVVAKIDKEAPQATLAMDRDVVRAGDKVKFIVSATDNDAMYLRALEIGETIVTLDVDGNGWYTFTTPGEYRIQYGAMDVSGNVTYLETVLTVL